MNQVNTPWIFPYHFPSDFPAKPHSAVWLHFTESQIHPKIIVYVHCPSSLEDASFLESIRKFCSGERVTLAGHSLVTHIKKIHISLLWEFLLRLKRTQAIGSRIGCILESGQDCPQRAASLLVLQSTLPSPATPDKRHWGLSQLVLVGSGHCGSHK